MNTVPERLVSLVGSLREHGMRVGTSETVDAAAIVTVLGLDDREMLREGLAAALVRRGGERAVFDPVFDLYFPAGVGSRSTTGEGAQEAPPDSPPRETAAALRDRLVDALAADDDAALAALAGEAVDSLGGFAGGSGPGSSGAGWSARQALEQVQPQTLLVRALSAAEDGADAAFTDRLERDEMRRRIERFRHHVRSDALRRTAEVRDRDTVSRHAVRPTTDRISFLTADRGQLDELRRTITPLARKLATRIAARRHRASRGTIDVRRTIRRSLTTGGVPVRPAYDRRRRAKPELVLLCDVSGSVAGFAGFTMMLVQALREQFTRVRVFAFVNLCDEVTDLVRDPSDDPRDTGARVNAQAHVRSWHSNSDYGRALEDFWLRYEQAVGPRTTVLVLGDARTNGTDPNLAALERIADRARRTYWLNPERRTMWQSGDSAADRYAEVVPMWECRNIAELGEIIARLIPV